MKKILSRVLILALLIPYGTLACADDIVLYDGSTTRVYTTISISNGKVCGTVSVNGAGNRSTSISVQVQKKIGSSWSTVATSSGTEGASVTVTAESGATYRVYGHCKVYDASGKLIETSYKYSAEKQY